MSKKEEINFRDRDLLFIDLETTGLDIDKHEIIEIGCLVVDGKTLNVVKEYQTRVKPTHLETASEEGIKVAGYSSELWVDAIPLEEALKQVVKLAPGAMVAGWKVDFDWWFLEKALRRFGIGHSFDYHLIDVISMAYARFRYQKQPGGIGLRKVAPFLGIEVNEQHDALGDIKATYKIFKELMKRERGVRFGGLISKVLEICRKYAKD